MARNLGTHPAWLSNSTIPKFCYPSYMVIIPTASKHCYLCLAFLPDNFKILPTFHHGIFSDWYLIPLIYFFWRYVETVCQLQLLLLVILLCWCHTISFSLNFLCLWAMVSIRRLLQVPPLTFIHLPGFHQVCLLFYKKYFINLRLLLSGYLRKLMYWWRK